MEGRRKERGGEGKRMFREKRSSEEKKQRKGDTNAKRDRMTESKDAE